MDDDLFAMGAPGYGEWIVAAEPSWGAVRVSCGAVRVCCVAVVMDGQDYGGGSAHCDPIIQLSKARPPSPREGGVNDGVEEGTVPSSLMWLNIFLVLAKQPSLVQTESSCF